jgi:DNA-binding transcriptional ArsR family regulator
MATCRLTSPPAAVILSQMVKSYARTLDRTFAALSDPTRREILERLTDGPASISQLARPRGMSLPGVMKHVRILERAGLVSSEKRGRTRECRLGPARLDDATRWIAWYRRQWERRLDRLEAYLAGRRE